MILIVLVRLHASALEPGPFLTHVSVLPLDLVHYICRHAQDTRRANVAMVVCLHHGVFAHHGIFDNEGGLVGQSQVPLRVICVHDVGTAAILKGFGFLPVH